MHRITVSMAVGVRGGRRERGSVEHIDMVQLVDRNRGAAKIEGRLLQCRKKGMMFTKDVEEPTWVEWEPHRAVLLCWPHGNKKGLPQVDMNLLNLLDVQINASQAMFFIRFLGNKTFWFKAPDDDAHVKWARVLRLYCPTNRLGSLISEQGYAQKDATLSEGRGSLASTGSHRGRGSLASTGSHRGSEGQMPEAKFRESETGVATTQSQEEFDERLRINRDKRRQLTAQKMQELKGDDGPPIYLVREQVQTAATRCKDLEVLREALLVLQASDRILANEGAVLPIRLDNRREIPVS